MKYFKALFFSFSFCFSSVEISESENSFWILIFFDKNEVKYFSIFDFISIIFFVNSGFCGLSANIKRGDISLFNLSKFISKLGVIFLRDKLYPLGKNL